jgi:predicted ribosomally synthesized peptide with nif11-like leader
MSKEHVIQFLKKMAEDTTFRAQFGTDTERVPLASLVSAGAAAGLAFTAEEFQSVIASFSMGELSQEDLETVSGGIGVVIRDPIKWNIGDNPFNINKPQGGLNQGH